MRIVFIGTGEIGVPTMRALQRSEHELGRVVTQPDKAVGREQKTTAPTIKKALIAGGPNAGLAQTLQLARIKQLVANDHIRALQPDVLVVMPYGQNCPR